MYYSASRNLNVKTSIFSTDMRLLNCSYSCLINVSEMNPCTTLQPHCSTNKAGDYVLKGLVPNLISQVTTSSRVLCPASLAIYSKEPCAQPHQSGYYVLKGIVPNLNFIRRMS